MNIIFDKESKKFSIVDIEYEEVNIIINSTLNRMNELSNSIAEILLIIPETHDYLQKKELKRHVKYLNNLKIKMIQDIHKIQNVIKNPLIDDSELEN